METHNLKESLQGKVPKKIIKDVPRSYDAVGDVAVLEIPKAIQKYEKVIGQAFIQLHKQIKTVVKKVGGHVGKLRIQKYKVIAGEKKMTATYKENNAVFKFAIDKTYFSVRLSNERKRIALLVKPNEKVLVMFSGIAPYPVIIAKNAKPKKIVGVELNKTAYKFAKENVIKNKVTNVELIQGDVRKVIPKLKGTFDRIIMPLPKDADTFLDVALMKIKKKGIIHVYDFLPEDELYKATENIEMVCKKAKKKWKLLSVHKCGQQGPRMYRICIDIQIL